MPTNPKGPARRGRRPIVDLDPADSLLLRQIHEQATILIRKQHVLWVEVSELREEQKKLRAVVLTLLADPQAREDAEAVIREFMFTKNNPK